jgi:hypothetical protein
VNALVVSPFVGWHCSGVFGYVRCAEPCVWCVDEAAKNDAALADAGYVVAPMEPTTEMLQDGQIAGKKAKRGGVSGMTIDSQVRAECAVEAEIYRAMLAAFVKGTRE